MWKQLFGGLGLAVGLMGYASYRLLSMPTGNTASFTAAGRPKGPVVACLGDSITHGHIGHQWVADLRKEVTTHTFINAGVNSELAYNVDMRLQEVLDLDPDVAVLLIGANDVMASLNDVDAATYMKDQKLPQLPDEAFFSKHLISVLSRLQQKGVAKRAVLTLSPLGETRASEANSRVQAYNAIIRTAAAATDTAVIDLNTALWGFIDAQDPLEPPTDDRRWQTYVGGLPRLAPMLSAGFKHYLMGSSWEDSGKKYGLMAVYDFVHLNEKAAAITSELVKEFVLA